ncbi:MAG: hypothetical protein ACKOAW_01425 [Actinomycetota bacterium]
MRAKSVVLGVALAVTASCLVAMSPAGSAPTYPRAASLTDIVLVADNTGLTAKEWDLQKKAYLAMLDDPARIPRDGSVAISLIQYVNPTGGKQGSKVTVPLAPVTASSLAEIRRRLAAAALLSAQQAGLEPLSAVASELSEHGRTGSDRSVCGTASAPWSTTQVSTASQAIKSAAVDRSAWISTIVGSRPTSETADLSDLASGEGSLVGTRSLAQAMSFIADACLNAPVRLRAIEVNQVIQNWNNDIPLVADKATVVRVFLETVTRTSDVASGVLHGSRGGSPLPGSPLSPINAGEDIVIWRDAATRSVRSDLEGSLNFTLPSSWLSGDVELRFEATSNLVCAGSPPGRDCAVAASFIEGENPPMAFVRVPYTYDGDLYEPTTSDSSEWMKRMRDAFPVADIDDRYLVTSPAIPWAPTMHEANALLYWNRDWEIGGEVASGERWIGVLAGDPDPDWGGFAINLPGYVASAEVDGAGGSEDYGWARNSSVHEAGHLYGAHHIVNEAENGTVEGEEGTYPAGWCGEKGRVTAPDYPYWDTFGSADAPTLGPHSDSDQQVWGMAPRFVGVNTDLALIDPYAVFPLMSYCSGSDSTSQTLWPDVQSYEVLTERFLDSDIEITSRATGAAKSTGLPGLWVRGIIDPSGEASATVATTLPFPATRKSEQDRSLTVDATDTGFHIQLLDLFRNPVATQTVPTLEGSGRAQQGQGDDTAPVPFPFSAVFPASVAKKVASVTVSRLVPGQQPRVIATLDRTPRSPRVTVDVARPNAAGVEVSWVIADPDSPKVTASVLYRTSAQSPWKLVALDAPGDSLVIPRDALPGAANAQFAVIAGDGINTAVAVSRTLPIPNGAPTVSLDGPAVVELVGGQNAVVTAFAYDTEDGDISGKVTWRVGRTSLKGTGRALAIAADDLPEGSHVVTATITDSARRSTTARMTVTVQRLAD